MITEGIIGMHHKKGTHIKRVVNYRTDRKYDIEGKNYDKYTKYQLCQHDI